MLLWLRAVGGYKETIPHFKTALHILYTLYNTILFVANFQFWSLNGMAAWLK